MKRSRRMCEPENLAVELEYLSTALQKNGFTKVQFNR